MWVSAKDLWEVNLKREGEERGIWREKKGFDGQNRGGENDVGERKEKEILGRVEERREDEKRLQLDMVLLSVRFRAAGEWKLWQLMSLWKHTEKIVFGV